MERPANSYTMSLGLRPALSAIDPGVTEKIPAPWKFDADTASAPKFLGKCVTSSGPTQIYFALADSMKSGMPLCLTSTMKAFFSWERRGRDFYCFATRIPAGKRRFSGRGGDDG
jgi:hypothetical protein